MRHRNDDAPAPEPLSHKLLVAVAPIVVENVCTAVVAAFGRWHRAKIAARAPKASE